MRFLVLYSAWISNCTEICEGFLEYPFNSSGQETNQEDPEKFDRTLLDNHLYQKHQEHPETSERIERERIQGNPFIGQGVPFPNTLLGEAERVVRIRKGSAVKENKEIPEERKKVPSSHRSLPLTKRVGIEGNLPTLLLHCPLFLPSPAYAIQTYRNGTDSILFLSRLWPSTLPCPGHRRRRFLSAILLKKTIHWVGVKPQSDSS